MAEDWNAIAAEVAEGLASVGDVGAGAQGFTVTLHKTITSGPAWDPVITNVDYELSTVEYPYKISNRDGTVIQANDKFLFVQAGIAVPEMADTVTANGIGYQIINIMPLSPAGIDVLYELQLRK